MTHQNEGPMPGAIKRGDWLALPTGRLARVTQINETCSPPTVMVVAAAAGFDSGQEHITFTLPFVRKHCQRRVGGQR